jgi:hypothetical protein
MGSPPKFFLPLLLLSHHCMAQQAAKPDAELLYSGTEYVKVFGPTNGTPFFPTRNNNGSVLYHGNLYRDLELIYDCEDDDVVIRDLQGQLKLRLVREKLEGFEVDGHRFVKLRLLSPEGEFYEDLYNGRRRLLIQWQKKMASDQRASNEYALKKSVFVLEEGRIIPLDRSADLFDIVQARKNEARRIYREKRLNFKKDPEGTALSMLREMESKGW